LKYFLAVLLFESCERSHDNFIWKANTLWYSLLTSS